MRTVSTALGAALLLGVSAASSSPATADVVRRVLHASLLPGPVLIADRGNNRLVMIDPRGRVVWQFPRPSDVRRGQTMRSPDDAFFSEDGKRICVTSLIKSYRGRPEAVATYAGQITSP